MSYRFWIIPFSLLFALHATAGEGSSGDDDDDNSGNIGSVEVYQNVHTPVVQEVNFPETPAEIINLDIQGQNQPFLEVDTRGRAVDFEEAFRRLADSQPDANIFAIVAGRSIDHVVDLKVMRAGTLVMLTTRYRSGEDHHIVKVEDLEELGIRGRSKPASPVTYPSGWK